MSRIKKLIRMILSYSKRFFNGTSFRAWVVDSKIHKTARVQAKSKIRYSMVGKYTYIGAGTSLVYTRIGSFNSIASEVKFGGGKP